MLTASAGAQGLLLAGHFLAAVLWAFSFAPRFPQDPKYHDFADKRRMCCVPNANDVLVRGAAWRGVARRARTGAPGTLRPARSPTFRS